MTCPSCHDAAFLCQRCIDREDTDRRELAELTPFLAWLGGLHARRWMLGHRPTVVERLGAWGFRVLTTRLTTTKQTTPPLVRLGQGEYERSIWSKR